MSHFSSHRYRDISSFEAPSQLLKHERVRRARPTSQRQATLRPTTTCRRSPSVARRLHGYGANRRVESLTGGGAAVVAMIESPPGRGAAVAARAPPSRPARRPRRRIYITTKSSSSSSEALRGRCPLSCRSYAGRLRKRGGGGVG